MKIYPLRLIPSHTNIDFTSFKKRTYSISLVISILSIIWICFAQFNYGIDFIGGINIEARIGTKPDIALMRDTLNKLKIGEVTLQTFGSDKDFSIKVSGNKKEDLIQNVNLIKETLSKCFPIYEIEYRKTDFVGPQVGAQLIKSGIKALIYAFIAIMIYIWFRFEWQFGVGVVLALIHDAILCLGFMSISQLDFNQSSIAAILTVIGYSVNDSVVIYDRIRENLRKHKQHNIEYLVNLSINQTLSRTVLTVTTTLLASLALVFFGGPALRSFSLLVSFGIIAGTYSSIFISAPLLTSFKLPRNKIN